MVSEFSLKNHLNSLNMLFTFNLKNLSDVHILLTKYECEYVNVHS